MGNNLTSIIQRPKQAFHGDTIKAEFVGVVTPNKNVGATQIAHSQDPIENLRLQVQIRRKADGKILEKAEFQWGQRVFSTHEIEWVELKVNGDYAAPLPVSLPFEFYDEIQKNLAVGKKTGSTLCTRVKEDFPSTSLMIYESPEEMRVYYAHFALEAGIDAKKTRYEVELLRIVRFRESIHFSPPIAGEWHEFTVPVKKTDLEYRVDIPGSRLNNDTNTEGVDKENAASYNHNHNDDEYLALMDKKLISLRKNLVGSGFKSPEKNETLVVGRLVGFARDDGIFANQAKTRWEEQAILESMRAPSPFDVFRPALYCVYSLARPDNNGRAVFNHPLEFTFSHSDSGPPCRILLQAFSTDFWNRHRFIGYSYCDVPRQAGQHDLKCHFWYPEGSLEDRLKFEYCGGFRPLIHIREVIGAGRKIPHNWSSMRTATSVGALHIHLDVAHIVGKQQSEWYARGSRRTMFRTSTGKS